MENLELKKSKINKEFWQGKKVFITGHTGFKGGWLSLWLHSLGAIVTGYSLYPKTSPNIYEELKLEKIIKKSIIKDIRNIAELEKEIYIANPEILIHMAAQPLVRQSYVNPMETYTTNVIGTLNILEIVRKIKKIKSVLIITTDKCYENENRNIEYSESDSLGGSDPYSSSKTCTEIITNAYRKSFFNNINDTKLATARAGNVIGGGDWSEDRLIPDALKAFCQNESLIIRNPDSIRPWQHVLEPLSGYIILCEKLYYEKKYATSWNFGPNNKDNKKVKEVIKILIEKTGITHNWIVKEDNELIESKILKLNCDKAERELGWKAKWNIETALEKVIDWQNNYNNRINMTKFTLNQINEYMDK